MKVLLWGPFLELSGPQFTMDRVSERWCSLRGVHLDVAGVRHLSRSDQIPKGGILVTAVTVVEFVYAHAQKGP